MVMSETIELSVVISAYNLEHLLPRCLDSIVANQIAPFTLECIIVDDGSTDATLEVARQYERNFPSVRVTTMPHGGIGPAKNLGLSLAKGRYIWFVDGDDYVLPGAFNKLAPHFSKYHEKNSFPDLLLINAISRDPNGKEFPSRYSVPPEKLFSINEHPELLIWFLAPWRRLVSRQFLLNEGISFPNVIMTEDVYFTVLVYLKAKTITLIAETLYVYSLDRPGNVNTATESEVRVTSTLTAVKEIESVVKGLELSYEVKKFYWFRLIETLLWMVPRVSYVWKSSFVICLENILENVPREIIIAFWQRELEVWRKDKNRGDFRYYLPLFILKKFKQLNENRPLLSIIITCNDKDSTSRSIQNLCNQTLPREYYEVILLSPQAENQNWLSHFEACTNIKISPLPTVADAPGIPLEALQLAKGSFIYCASTSVLVEPFAFKFMLTEALINKVDILIGGYEQFVRSRKKNLEGRKSGPWKFCQTPTFNKLSMKEQQAVACALHDDLWSKLYRKDFLVAMLDKLRLKVCPERSFLLHFAAVSEAAALKVYNNVSVFQQMFTDNAAFHANEASLANMWAHEESEITGQFLSSNKWPLIKSAFTFHFLGFVRDKNKQGVSGKCPRLNWGDRPIYSRLLMGYIRNIVFIKELLLSWYYSMRPTLNQTGRKK